MRLSLRLPVRKSGSRARHNNTYAGRRQPFGEFERLITQKLVDVIKRVAKQELDNEKWLHAVARLSNRSYEQMRVTILEFRAIER